MLAAMALAPAAAQGARQLRIGFVDSAYSSADPAERATWLGRSVDAGAQIVRIPITWAVANTRTRPAGFDARNPADPAYDFALADAAIKDAVAHGLQVLAYFSGAPRWAEGPGRPAAAPRGSWRPDPRAIEDYGAALARRYSGRFPDPAVAGAVLPRVHALQVWNEPNLDTYLTPQWRAGRTFAPAHYRRMLNAFYRGVKSVSPATLVVTAGTAPFGDEEPGGERIMPVRFARDLLCIRRVAGRLRSSACPTPARFDVFTHHPYSIEFPRRRALNADDVSIPDMGKLTRILRKAEASGRALPRKRHPVWVTEVSYDSSPPDPDGIPIARHARYLEQTLFLLWRQGVDTIMWFRVGDQAPIPSFDATYQSGVYFRDGRAKPAQRAFRFPFVAERAGRTTVRVWGRAPIAGTVVVERRTPAGWRAVRSLRTSAGRIFELRLKPGSSRSLRARIGPETSLVWPLA